MVTVKLYFELFCVIAWHVALICKNPNKGFAFRVQITASADFVFFIAVKDYPSFVQPQVWLLISSTFSHNYKSRFGWGRLDYSCVSNWGEGWGKWTRGQRRHGKGTVARFYISKHWHNSSATLSDQWHDDKAFLPQSKTFCTDKRLLGHFPFLRMMILSDMALVVPRAQQEPQYRGMCWFRVTLGKFPLPGTDLQWSSLGMSSGSRYEWERGVFL